MLDAACLSSFAVFIPCLAYKLVAQVTVTACNQHCCCHLQPELALQNLETVLQLQVGACNAAALLTLPCIFDSSLIQNKYVEP